MLAPSPPAVPVFGHALALRRDMLGSFLRWGRDHGPVVRLQLLRQRAYLVADPAGIKHVLQDNQRNYTKDTRGYRAVKLLLGDGLLTSEGELWRRQRRIAQPAFKRERIAALLPLMDQAAAGALDRLDAVAQAGAAGGEVDIHREMTRTTLRIASETLLGYDISAEENSVGQALGVLLSEAEGRINAPALPLWLPTPRNRRLRAGMRLLHQVVDRTIAERRALGERKPEDLLTLLMEARDEHTGRAMEDRQLRDEVLTMFLAGHETTANQLTWTLYLLAQDENRPTAERLSAELAAFWQTLAGRSPGAAELRQLTYTEQVLRESMRLYPPAWIFSRAPQTDDTVCGYHIERHSWVFLSPYVMHRLPSLWPDAERFRPERFAAGETDGARYSYFPFGGGPRLCIGSNFAMLEALLLLARLWPRYRFTISPGQDITPLPQITLRPAHGLRMRVARRD